MYFYQRIAEKSSFLPRIRINSMDALNIKDT